MARALFYLFLAGFAAAVYSVRFYPPVKMSYLWITLAVIFVIGLLLFRSNSLRVHQRRREAPPPSPFLVGFALLPLVVVACVVVNGALDRSASIPLHMTVVGKRAGRGGYRINLSPNGSNDYIAVPTTWPCSSQLQRGQKVTLLEKQGLLRIHWISGIVECGAR